MKRESEKKKKVRLPWRIENFLHERKMRKLKLGTVCWKDGELKTVNVSWDVHWASNIYLSAIIRDYLRLFLEKAPIIVKSGLEHDEEGTLLPSAYETLDDEAASKRWKDLLTSVADKFDVLADAKKVEQMDMKQYRAATAAAFDGLKELFPDLSW